MPRTWNPCVDSGSYSIIHGLRLTTAQRHVDDHTVGTRATMRVLDSELETGNDG